MDNASKALIMAGSILLAIAIVGVGVYIYSTSSSMGDVAGGYMDSAQAQLANNDLKQYAGNRVIGGTVISLLDYIDVVNKNGIFPKDIKLATSKFDRSATGELVKSKSEILKNTYYCLIWADDNGDSYYDKLQITTNGFLGDEIDVANGLIDLTGDDENSGDNEMSGDDTALNDNQVSGENITYEEENTNLESDIVDNEISNETDNVID